MLPGRQGGVATDNGAMPETTRGAPPERVAPVTLGTSILGFIAAVLSYFICYQLVVRFRQKDETLAELTKEMEAVGEDIE